MSNFLETSPLFICRDYYRYYHLLELACIIAAAYIAKCNNLKLFGGIPMMLSFSTPPTKNKTIIMINVMNKEKIMIPIVCFVLMLCFLVIHIPKRLPISAIGRLIKPVKEWNYIMSIYSEFM